MSINKENTQGYLEIFISVLFKLVPDEDVFNIRTILEGEEEFTITNQFHTKEELLTIGHEYVGLNKKGSHILIGINPRDSKDAYPTRSEHVKHCPCLFIDFDDIGESTYQDIHEAIVAQKLPIPTLTISSGHGFHVYWRLNTLLTPEEWISYQRRLNHNVRYADEKIKDPARCMRLPGFQNTKEPWTECIIADATDMGHDISVFDDILSQLPQVKEEERNIVLPENMDYPATLDKAQNYCAKWEILTDGRKQAAYTLGCTLLHDFQLTMDDAMTIAQEWNEKQGNYFTTKKLSKQIRCGGLYAKGPKGTNAVISKRRQIAPNIGIRTGLEIQANRRHIEWVWDRVIPLGHLCMLGGKKGVMKTLISESIVATLTSSTNALLWPDMSRRGDPGNVLIINMEDSPEEVSLPRITQIGGDPNRICWMDLCNNEEGKLELFNIGEVHKLVYMLEQQKEMQGAFPRLIVIDHLTDFLVPGKKYSGDIAQTIYTLNLIARKYHLSILILYHFRKDIGDGDHADMYRGSMEHIMGIKGPLLGVFPDKEDDNASYLITTQSNIPTNKLHLKFEVGGYFDDDTYRVDWSAAEDYVTIDTLRARPTHEEEEATSLREDAGDWLIRQLHIHNNQGFGRQIQEWFNAEKRQLGFGWQTVTAARRRLKNSGAIRKGSNGLSGAEYDTLWEIAGDHPL